MRTMIQRVLCRANECEGLCRTGEDYCSSCRGKVQPWTCPVCATGHHFPTGALVRRCYYCGNAFDRRSV